MFHQGWAPGRFFPGILRRFRLKYSGFFGSGFMNRGTGCASLYSTIVFGKSGKTVTWVKKSVMFPDRSGLVVSLRKFGSHEETHQLWDTYKYH